MADRTILILGGGASGALCAVALLKQDDKVNVTIIEPRERLGRGTAYSTPYPEHLLNVPASRMSAFADAPTHFIDWLRARYGDRYAPASFAPRSIYGDYLENVLERAAADAGSRFRHVHLAATSVEANGSGVSVTCSNGTVVDADGAIVAFGNAEPARWAGIEAVSQANVYTSAWEPGALEPHDPSEDVLLLGTGLTAIDAVLGLRHNGHRGTIHMISRRGLLPHEHRLFDVPPAANPEALTMVDLVASVRELVRASTAPGVNWRASIDAVRGRTNDFWKALPVEDQQRFVRHAMPYWNVHRHRMAPEIAKSIADLIAAERLHMIAGRTVAFRSAGERVEIDVRERGTDDITTLRVNRLINCSGPQNDITKRGSPLVADMIAKGLLCAHPIGIGIDVDDDGALRNAEGVPSSRLFAIGPVRYGTLIETTAIPEIRVQADALAARLLESACAG